MPDDTVALTSDIGTWTAVFFAFVALTGIIGPWLAIRAASSNQNRALNAIYDRDKIYVKFSGIPIGSRLRVFRKIRVPNLAPSYKSNVSMVVPLIPFIYDPDRTKAKYISSAHKTIKFRPESYSGFNKGWSKLCRMLDSYKVEYASTEVTIEDSTGSSTEASTQAATKASKFEILALLYNSLRKNLSTQAATKASKFKIPASGGALEVVNSDTALVVNRGWILIIGLLGRYSDHEAQTTLDPTVIQQSLQGDLHSVHGSVMDTELDNATTNSDCISRVGRLGPLSDHPSTKISGITGAFRLLGERSGSRLDLSTIKFRPRHKAEVMGRATKPGTRAATFTTSSIAKEFWLASGLIPTDTDVVLSIEDPIPDDPGNNLLKEIVASNPPIRYFELQSIRSVPAFVKNSMVSLGLRYPRIQRFQEIKWRRETARYTIVRRRPRSFGDGIQFQPMSRPSGDNTRWIALTDGDKVTETGNEGLKYMRFSREHVEKALFAFLSLEWDTYGHLVWKSDCLFWRCLLRRALVAEGDDSDISHVIRKHLKDHLLYNDSIEVFDWKFASGPEDSYVPAEIHNPMKTHHLKEFEHDMRSSLSSRNVEDLGAVIGTMLIIDPTLATYVQRLCSDEWLSSQTEYETEYDTPEEGDSPETVHANTRPRFLSHPSFQYNIADRMLANRQDNIPGTSLELMQWHCSICPPFETSPEVQVVAIPAEDIVRIALWTAAKAGLWLSSLDSRPLLSFCKSLSHNVYVV